MITKIEIDGFKTFKNFSMEFTPLTVIAGTNASGKSNLFDALHLLSCLASLDLRSAFATKQLRGGLTELFTKIDNENSMTEMSFAVEMLVARNIQDNWGGVAELKTPRLRYEIIIVRNTNAMGLDELSVKHERLSRIATDDDKWAKLFLKKNTGLWKSSRSGGSSTPYINTIIEKGLPTIKIRQDGRQGGRSIIANTANQTVLGSINSVEFPHIFAAQREMASWNFMQLNPEMLREPTRYDIGYTGNVIGHAGENLAAAMYRLNSMDKYNLQKIILKLSSFLPDYTELYVRDDKANKQFIFELKNKEGKAFTSRVLSEGTLRLLTLCVLLYDDEFSGLLCFEEPENGIHPHRMKAMAELLQQLSLSFDDNGDALRQVIVNTHSPILLRCLADNKLETPENVSIWFSRLVSHNQINNGKRERLRISRITPLKKSFQISSTFSPVENQLTIADAMNFLNQDTHFIE